MFRSSSCPKADCFVVRTVTPIVYLFSIDGKTVVSMMTVLRTNALQLHCNTVHGTDPSHLLIAKPVAVFVSALCYACTGLHSPARVFVCLYVCMRTVYLGFIGL